MAGSRGQPAATFRLRGRCKLGGHRKSSPPVNVPGDFPYSANALEPVALSVADSSTLFYTSTTNGGDLILDLHLYGWSALKPGQKIPDVVNKVTVESLSPWLSLPGGYVSKTPGTWTVADDSSNSSVWHIDVAGLAPTCAADASLMIVVETKYNYDNGFGTQYPTGASLSSYFAASAHIKPYNPIGKSSSVLQRDYLAVHGQKCARRREFHGRCGRSQWRSGEYRLVG